MKNETIRIILGVVIIILLLGMGIWINMKLELLQTSPCELCKARGFECVRMNYDPIRGLIPLTEVKIMGGG